MSYLPRIVDTELTELLAAAGAVIVEGPRASGKTATALRAAASAVLLDVDENARRMIGLDPAAVLAAGDTPRLIDEWQPAWSPHLRSRTTLRRTPVRHFVDPSLAVAALRAAPGRLTADLEFLGLLFESLVVRDLRVHAQAADAQVFHYREKDGLEVDAVVEAADGRWAAFEIKLGERWVEDGARNLRRLAGRMEHSDHGPPSALAVIVPAGYGSVRPGDVGIVPIDALGP